MSTSVNVNPCNEEEKILRSASYLTNPRVYTPANRFSETQTVNMSNHELKILNSPYSAADINLVNIGVVMNDMPFCKNAQIKNQNEALTCMGIFL